MNWYIIPDIYSVVYDKTFFIVGSYEGDCKFFICCLCIQVIMWRGSCFKELIEECGSSTVAYIAHEIATYSRLKLLSRLNIFSSYKFVLRT